MLSMIKKIRNWLTSKTMICEEPFIVVGPDMYREDTKAKEAIKRVRKAFKQQESAMNARALRAHDAKCPDALTCKKKKCFTVEPDKIVSDPYIVERVTKRNDLK